MMGRLRIAAWRCADGLNESSELRHLKGLVRAHSQSRNEIPRQDMIGGRLADDDVLDIRLLFVGT